MFVSYSILDIRCSMLDVHLFLLHALSVLRGKIIVWLTL